MRLYFERHDGQAVTCEDFVRCMADASGRDLGQFMRWYAQAGTPELKVTRSYDPARQALTLEVSQSTPATPGQPEKLPFHLPIRLGLVGADGAAQPLQLEGENEPKGTDRVLELTEASQSFTFLGLDAGAGAVAAARLLGPGEARCRLRRRRPRPADGPRQRRVHALGRRPAAGRQRAAGAGPRPCRGPCRRSRSTRGWSRPSPPASIARREDPAFAARALSLPEQRLSRPADGRDRRRGHPPRASTMPATSWARSLRDRWLAAYRAHSDDGPFSLDDRGHGAGARSRTWRWPISAMPATPDGQRAGPGAVRARPTT